LEHLARAISALYAAEAESPTESAAGADLRSALEALSLALEALHQAPRARPELEDATAAVARAVAQLYPAVRTSYRQRREVLPPDVMPSQDRRALVELGNVLAPPAASARPRPTLTFEGPDQRRALERQVVTVDVGLLSDSNFYTGLSEDVSEGGVFVATEHPLAIGTPVTLFFTFQPGISLEAAGIVRWIREGASGTAPGMGVAFSELREDVRRAVAAYAASRPPLFHG
ncbi:MAG TPA: TIGR02266 family protein, partial [Polyangiaceae bacterium]